MKTEKMLNRHNEIIENLLTIIDDVEKDDKGICDQEDISAVVFIASIRTAIIIFKSISDLATKEEFLLVVGELFESTLLNEDGDE